MKIIIDILHPAHVHVFRNFITQMKEKGHLVLITARKKDISLDLLDLYNLDYIKISDKASSAYKLALELFFRNIKFRKICKQFKPDLLMGIMGPTISTVGKLMDIPSYTFYDTETAKATNWFTYPLSTAVVTPSCYTGKVNSRHVTYPGYHELAYLHPDLFEADPGILSEVGLKKGDSFFILRLVSWKASHDIGYRGFTNPLEMVKKLEKYGKVLITSEEELSPELEPYRVSIPPHKMHDLMAFSTMYIGESVTMASEAVVLGVPAILIVEYGISYTDEQEEKYDMVYRFSDQKKGFEKALQLLENSNLKEDWNKKWKTMMGDKINVTKWMVNFIEEEYARKNKELPKE
jgi:uncharacterized protein